jgi:hypothetical protein
MDYTVGTDYQACTVRITIRSLKPCTIRIVAYDRDRPNTVFTNRFENVMQGEERNTWIPMPLTPKNVIVSIYTDTGNKTANEEVNFKIIDIHKYPNVFTDYGAVGLFDAGLASFMDLAQRFCFNAGILPVNQSGECYCSRDKLFKIQYLPILTDQKTGQEVSTPMRISSYTRVIEASQAKLLPMSVPGRFCIATHEYSHEFENKNPDDELEADINGLTIYLGMGYSKYEAIDTYATTFYNSPTDENLSRFKHIEKFVKNFSSYT